MENTIALYVHIPFCKQKCLYCDFPSFACKESLMFDYTKALCKEIDSIKNNNIGSIFIGGGTPTYLSLDCFKMLKVSIDGLRKAHDLEFTIEGNPDSFSEEKLFLFKSMGVNRLSIGLQAWQDSLLKQLGRVHNQQQFLKVFNTARALGFRNINVDLMFGLPNQSFQHWKETLQKVSELNPEHISAYSLIVEEETPFSKLMERGSLQLPCEEEERKMSEYTEAFLKKNGYERYEISNYCREGKECRHNLTYWNVEEYIGCGSAAHSYVDHYRYRNTADIEKYIDRINRKNSAVEERKQNSKKDDMEEFMFMGLRKLEGISKTEFYKRFNIDINSIYGKVIEKFTDKKLLCSKEDSIRLTSEGIELSNQVMCEFILD